MNSIDLAFAPALKLACLIRQKEISPLALVEIFLSRIDRLDRQLGSYFFVATESAIADATAKTETLANYQSTDELPPFFGVPISIKDLQPVAGMPHTFGVAALKDNIADRDSALVAKLKQAGFILLGKTATCQLGTLPYTEPPGFPPARNPWNLDYTPGGSSGGAAAATAAGLCPVAQASDGGGSIRGPAACCGLVGIKPSRGRVSAAPLGERFGGLGVCGPLARNVADAAAVLDVMSGYVVGDPYWLPDPQPSFLEMTKRPPKPLRVAFATEIVGLGKADASYEKAVRETARSLSERGHSVEPACPKIDDITEPFTTIWQAMASLSGLPLEALDRMNTWNAQRNVQLPEYWRSMSALQAIARRIVSFSDKYDVLVLPTYLHSTIRIGEWDNLSPAEMLQKIITWIAPAPPFNVTGQPVVSFPMGCDENGLPVGVQLVGKPADEGTIVALAAQLEAARSPWKIPDFANI